jgi:hypothetical protein
MPITYVLRRSVVAIALVLMAILTAAMPQSSRAVGSLPVKLATPVAEQETTTAMDGDRRPCEDGRLLVADLPAMDAGWADGIAQGTEKAQGWHQDARLVELRVNCGLFEPGFRWQTSFYSAEAQAIHSTDTGESVPVSFEPDQISTLDLSPLSFAQLREVLLREGFTDDMVLNPATGIDLRTNDEVVRFGPPDAPVGQTLAHISVNRRGEIKDVFIDIETGDVYRFTMPTG